LIRSNFYLLRFSFRYILSSERFNHFSTLSLFHCSSSRTYVLYYFCIAALQDLCTLSFLHCLSSETYIVYHFCIVCPPRLCTLSLLHCPSSVTCNLYYLWIACPPRLVYFITFALHVLQNLKSLLLLDCLSSKTYVIHDYWIVCCLFSKTCVLYYFFISFPPKLMYFITIELLVLQDSCLSYDPCRLFFLFFIFLHN